MYTYKRLCVHASNWLGARPRDFCAAAAAWGYSK